MASSAQSTMEPAAPVLFDGYEGEFDSEAYVPRSMAGQKRDVAAALERELGYGPKEYGERWRVTETRWMRENPDTDDSDETTWCYEKCETDDEGSEEFWVVERREPRFQPIWRTRAAWQLYRHHRTYGYGAMRTRRRAFRAAYRMNFGNRWSTWWRRRTFRLRAALYPRLGRERPWR